MTPDVPAGDGGPPPDPKAGRFLPLARGLQTVLALAAVLSLAAVIAPGDAGTALGWAAIAVVVAAPLGRVAWLAVRWFRRGDTRFGLVAVGVLLVVGVAALVG